MGNSPKGQDGDLSGANPYRVFLADGQFMFRQALRKILAEREDIEVIGEAGDGTELLESLKTGANPCLIILDISLLNLRGPEAGNAIKLLLPGVKILALTVHKDSEYLRQAVIAGADGCLLKEQVDSELFAAIENIRKGENYFSPFFQ